MKTNQSHSHGSAKLFRLCPRSKNNEASSSSSKNTKPVSKYFTKKDEDEDNMFAPESASLDSPYKNSLTYIKYVPAVDDPNDFKTPKPVKKVSKTFRANGVSLDKQNKIRKSKPKKPAKNKNSIFKISKDNFGQTDINPDHLQMALALSKSTYDLENPEPSKDTERDLPRFLSPTKIANVKTTLEKFGFKSSKSKIHPEGKMDFIEVSTRHKNSKFRFVTPILQIRTPDERESIITSKISLILNQNTSSPSKDIPNLQNEDELFSDLLKKYYKENIIFSTNKLKLEETVHFSYYTNSLNITPTKYQCGCLLKKWEEIPGRDKSPVRKKVHYTEQHLSKNYDKMLGNFENTFSKETDIEDVNIDSQKHHAKGEDELHEIDNASVKICNNKTDFAINSSGERAVDRNCISPDLFDSEDEIVYSPRTPENQNVFSQSLLNLSPSKSQGLLRPKNFNSNCDSLQETKIEQSKRDVFKDARGIEHFESYSSDMSQEIYNLMQASDDDTEELYLSSLKNEEKPVVYDLTQSSSSSEATDDEIEIIGNHKSNLTQPKYTKELRDKSIEEENKAYEHLSETNSNFDMSPLHIKDSNEFIQDRNLTCSSKTRELNVGQSPCKINCQSPVLFTSEYRRSSGYDALNFDSTKMLNVTDYVNQILNNNADGAVENVDKDIDSPSNLCHSINRNKTEVTLGKNFNDDNCVLENDCDNSDKSQDLSQGSCSQESIVISDEELNYSSVYSREAKNNKYFYDLSETDQSDLDNVYNDKMDIEDVDNMHSVLRSKYGSLSIPEPVHNRITELKQMPSTRRSLANEFLEDSFNKLLEDTDILESIENGTRTYKAPKKTEPVGESTNKENFINEHGNVTTPEKYNLPSIVKSDVTPENNLIIKTNNITPMANYDEMDTPKIMKQLQQFGLKPLKRQRGAKLLKHLYECTHPLVGPKEIEEPSSDEDDRRNIKKTKTNYNTASDNKIELTVKQDKCRWIQGNMDIVGDRLLENKNLEDLIFERKYSVKISSCRVPLQIVWHNFVSQNPEIKENILLYEPLQLEVLHSMLKEQSGCKFHIQDLLTFFDKKCITIRTAQAQGRRRTRK